MVQRHIEVDGSYNVRDLGEYPTVDGRQTRRGVLIRAGSLEKVTSTGEQQLVDYGVKTIIDLRDEWETQHYPDSVAQSATMTYLNLPMVGDELFQNARWKAVNTNHVTLDQLYGNMLDYCQTQIGQIVGALIEAEPAIVFHCFVGKDRTGLLAALLLKLAGVPDDVVVADYALTKDEITLQLAGWRAAALRDGQDMALFDRDFGCDAQAMLTTLSNLKARYGGAAAYLRTCGLTDAQLLRLQERLLS